LNTGAPPGNTPANRGFFENYMCANADVIFFSPAAATFAAPDAGAIRPPDAQTGIERARCLPAISLTTQPRSFCAAPRLAPAMIK